MKAALEYLPRQINESFVVKSFDYRHFSTPWHYHPELEIVLVTESTGTRYLGDHISEFKPGNLAFLGPNIPHTYKNDDRYYEEGHSLRAKSIVIHFDRSSLGESFLALPEARPMVKFFEHQAYGFDITGNLNKRVSNILYDIVHQTGMKRWLSLVELLHEISVAKADISHLTHENNAAYNHKESTRLCNVLNWMMLNLENEITLKAAADVAGMNPNAFSRFFSLRTRKTFSGYVKEMRLQKAASLLIETDLPVTQICYECGYNNISNFNRQFLDHYRLNPLRYKKAFLQKEI